MSSVNTESQDKGDVESSPKLPDLIDPTVAADSVRSQREPLLNLISHCLSSLANSLLAKSIIPRDVYKKACNPHLEDSERGGALLDCVETRIRLKASYFATFIDILKSEPFLSDLAEEMVQSYCTLSSIPTTKCPATISPAISQYAAYLRGVYRNSPISSDSKWPPTPSKKYINLATVEHDKCRDRFIGHTLHGNIKEVIKSRKEISIGKILVPDEEGVAYLKLVVIEGAPGIGKSTLAWELCRRWEQGSMEKYSLTVLLRLREKEVQEIRNIAEFFYFNESEDKKVLIKELSSSNGKGVLFVLDGFDELPTTLQKEGFLVNLIRGTFLPECTVVVTSRPSATARLLRICRPQIQKHIEVLGFTQESVEEYATSIFSSEPERLQGFKAFISASNNPAINSLMYVPLNAAIIVQIYLDSKSDHLLPRTLTQVYTQLCLTILNRYLESNNPLVALVNKFEDLPGHLLQEFLKLSEVAFNGMRRQEVIFHTLPSDLVHFGFLDAVSSLYGGGSVSYNFLHLTLQEFFAAYHISQLCGDARLAFLRECGSDSRWNVVWRFVAGLTEFKFFEGHLNSDLFISQSNADEVSVKDLFVQCFFEANSKMDRLKLFGLKSITVVHFVAIPLDMYALGYCIANLSCEVFWNVVIGYVDSIDFLVSGLKTNDISSYNNINKLDLNYCSDVLPHLKHFPLRGITDLTLTKCTFTSSGHLTKLLPSMLSLKRLSIKGSTFSDSQCADKFAQQLSQTNVTSLDIAQSNLSKYVSALQPLIDPVMGTLEELYVDQLFLHDVISPDSYMISFIHQIDTLFRSEEPCVDESFFHIMDSYVTPLIQLNTCLAKLHIHYAMPFSYSSPKEVEIIVGILEHSKKLEHLTVSYFEMSKDINYLRKIVEAIHKNITLKSITIVIRHATCNDSSELDIDSLLLELSHDPRISWESMTSTMRSQEIHS